MELTAPETRVLGCLLEKELATPNAYPLTLNAALAAANQTSNRDPVVSYDEPEVTDALAGLRQKGAARVVLGSGHRAEKYRHTLEEVWGLDEQHRAVLAVMMLRGPQTVGELRQRTERLARFDSLAEVEQVLRLLAHREEPLARRLERGPGQKEARWVELFSGEAAALEAAARTEADGPSEEGRPRSATEALREEVAALREEVEALRQQLNDLLH
jgi:uncharacterized protein YceH (UPF0502 family)